MKMILAVSIAALTTAAGGATFQTDDQFSITLPEGWVKIPGGVLQQFSNQMDQQYPDVHQQQYNYGFQLDTASHWLTYPYILVQVNRGGKVDQAALDRSENIKSGMEKSIALAKERFSACVSDAAVAAPTCDAENHMVWTTLSMDVAGERVKSIVGVKLTEYGFIRMSGYAPTDVFDNYVEGFKQAFANVSLDSSIEYQAQLPQAIQPAVATDRAGVGSFPYGAAALIGGVFWVVKILATKLIAMLSRLSTATAAGRGKQASDADEVRCHKLKNREVVQ